MCQLRWYSLLNDETILLFCVHAFGCERHSAKSS